MGAALGAVGLRSQEVGEGLKVGAGEGKQAAARPG